MTQHRKSGHCNCGIVSFQFTLPTRDIYACHCSICRRSTGNNGVAVVIVPKDAFAWTSGEERIRRWRKLDADWGCAFCDCCGSALPDDNDETHLYVPVGVIDDSDDLRLAHHIWVDSRARWDELPATGKRHARAFGD